MAPDPASSALVFAHPDDEVLWASSLLARAARVILCYGDVPDKPELSKGRRRAVARLPLERLESLDIAEAGVFELAAWPDPAPAPDGLALPPRSPAAPAYAANHARLIADLRPRLTGFASVVTHNPWGEYGHEEHVQVFRAVEALQRELGFALWVTCYVSEKSAGLMRECLGGLGASTPPMPTDPALGARLQAIYAEEGCWTWFEDYVWPAEERFHRWEPAQAAAGRDGAVHGMNCVRLGWSPRPARASVPLRALRRLGIVGAAQQQ